MDAWCHFGCGNEKVDKVGQKIKYSRFKTEDNQAENSQLDRSAEST